MRNFRTKTWCAAIAALPIMVAAGAMAGGPAVSETNVKMTGLYGTVDGLGDSADAWFGAAALTAPLSEKWGVQIEAGAGGVDGDSVLGAAGHLFKRDPDSYLAGLFVAYASVDEFDIEATRMGAELELYFDQVSLLGTVGYQSSDAAAEGTFASLDLRLYADDNFVLSAGAAIDEDNTIGRFGAEWQLASSALPVLALRIDAAVGDNDFSSVMGGITYYFASDASLKDRHRKQDPDSALFNLYQSLQAGASQAPIPPPPQQNN
jgi:hypothetical protein